MLKKLVLDGHALAPVSVLSGSPKESVLSLVLFLIFISSLEPKAHNVSL